MCRYVSLRYMIMHKAIKSFVLRAGRVSNRQQQGLDCWLKDYVLPDPCVPENSAPLCLETLFGRASDTIVEIGFGMGASLLSMATARPELNFIGVEVHRAGIGSLAADLHDHAVENVRIAPYDAVEVFKHSIADNSLAGVQIFFPDPWHKKRHHKRRLIQSGFIHELVKKIKPGGFIHCATDWEDYAQHILAVLSAEELLHNQQKDGGYSPKPDLRPLTKFEQRGQRLGHGVWDLIFVK